MKQWSSTGLGFAPVLALLVTATVASAGEIGAVGDLYVTGFSSHNVVQFDGETGVEVGQFVTPGSGGLNGPAGLTFGPNGNLFVCSRESDEILEYNGTLGAFVGQVIEGGYLNPAGGFMQKPVELAFLPDGRLLVAARLSDAIHAYDASTSEWLGTFAIGGSPQGGLDRPESLTRGPNGNLFVTSANTAEILEYHPTTGRLVRVFADTGLYSGFNSAFRSDGDLFVANYGTNNVARYDGQTGAFLGTFASGGGMTEPRAVTFGPNGNLFVAGKIEGADGVMEYDGTTGAVIGAFATSGTLANAQDLVFKPAPAAGLPAAPTVTGVSVSQHNACDPLTGVTVTGGNLWADRTTVLLTRADEPAAYIGTVTGESGHGTTLTVDFDLDGGARMPGGPWDVVVVNPEGQSATLAAAIEVTACYAASEENLFVLGYRSRGNRTTHGLFEFDGWSGDLMGIVVEDPTQVGDDLQGASDFAFGHDGSLLITSRNPFPGSVLQYHGITGSKIGTYIPVGTGGMIWPHKLAFGRNGNLFVLHRTVSGPCMGGVLEFDGMTGEFVRDLVPLGSCGLGCAGDLEFGPNADLYITDGEEVFRFVGETGACVGGETFFVPPPEPGTSYVALEISPHDGHLVLPWRTDTAPPGQGLGRVTENDPESGDLLATPISPPAGDIEQAHASCFGPNGHLFVAGYPDLVFEYDLVSGAVLGVFAAPGGGATEILFQALSGDRDGDWDRDLGDFAAFQACFGGEGVTPDDYNCFKLDHDRDGDVDLQDAARFTAAMTGPIN